MQNKQRGSGLVLLIILVVLIIAGIYFYKNHNSLSVATSLSHGSIEESFAKRLENINKYDIV